MPPSFQSPLVLVWFRALGKLCLEQLDEQEASWGTPVRDEREKEHSGPGGPPGCRAGLPSVHTDREDRGLCGKGLMLRHGAKKVLARLTGRPSAETA